ncbi:MAG: acetate--CoA ligase [Halobacteriovoraceae bacterium]|nr:acetate--CoA ligase [Halobacteriovoraceae bacterium]|tara:strand:- start:42379 stop:44283 length:1905 start_codon:yes stop_codon:yes gene_type:complete
MNQNISSRDDYEEHYTLSTTEPEKYWAQIAKSYDWKKEPQKIIQGDFNDLEIKWFEDGQLNITYNCLDRHLEKRGNKTAVMWEGNSPDDEHLSYTYNELHREVCRFANVLKDQGIKKGDRVVFYMSMVPELLTGVLACARIGAVHSVVFGGFSAQALAGRIQDCEAKLVVTNDEAYRGAKTIGLKEITDEALKSCTTVDKVLVRKRTHASHVNYDSTRDLDLLELLSQADDQCEPEWMNAEDPLFILYTSGSTGTPKGLLHTTGGYMVWAGQTFKNVFQMEEDDIYWCTADIGWITGHSYIAYGPLINGASSVIFEGIPTYPDAGRFWEIVEKYKITHFYTAPTAIRALQACDLKFVKDHDLSSLKVLGSVGEPINEEAWQWYHKEIGNEKCPIVDTWWQTETGGFMISPMAGITECIPSYATYPQPGILPQLVDNEGVQLEDKTAEGNLCITQPWPGMARTIWGNHERYRQTYFTTYPGKYFTGDGAKRDEKSRYRITGRVDDVMNISGHRIGTAEVEEAINEHPFVVESAVVGYPHDIKGQGIYAYINLNEGAEIELDKLKTEINEFIIKVIGPIAKPDQVQIVSGLPKTRSGKIMRRILRKVASKDVSNLGDISTLLNPEVVDEIKKGAGL